jgi:replicative DNA helicase
MMIEQKIIEGLFINEDYLRKVVPYLEEVYFRGFNEKTIFNLVTEYVDKYNRCPNIESIKVDLSNKTDLSEDQHLECSKYLSGIAPDSIDVEWLINETELFCQDQAIYNAIMESIQILDGKTKTSKGAIPTLLTDALSISFDPHIGHDFIDNADDRYEYYHLKEHKLPFNLEYFNKITKGGLSKKTLNICLAGTGVGKSLFMCHCAASNMMDGKNVLYITMEMAEEKIAERIDANLMGITLDELSILPKEAYDKKITRIKDKTAGRIIVKEYPTASAGVNHFRHLLNELKIKRNFIPDIIYVDYLNICMSARIKYGASVNSYTYIKAIAEELRGLAVEFNVPVFSATQTTRAGFTSSDIGLEDTSESFALPATADFMFAIISTEELDQLQQYQVKQLKNRYSDPGMFRRFILGVDKSRMKLFDVEQSAHDDIIQDDAPVFDSSERSRELFKDFK